MKNYLNENQRIKYRAVETTDRTTMIEKFDLVKYKIFSWQKHYEIGLYYGKDSIGHIILKGIYDRSDVLLTLHVEEVCIIEIDEIKKFCNS